MDTYNEHLKKVKQHLDQVSDTFCIAKWKQVTMHLQNGHTHSCHHPRTHVIPIEEIKRNPKALHNTEYKKQQRKLMLEGNRPEECDYCWKVEDNAKDSFSDRIYKSADENWAYPYLEDIKNNSYDDDVNPSYVEVSFSNVCNFKCSYCAPQFSSQWMEEIERHGPYPTSSSFNNLDWILQQKLIPISNKEDNAYINAFWEWWPKLYKEMKFFRITGGEPLLSKNTFTVLDYIIENPNTELNFSINTNLNPPKELFDKFLEKIKIIIDEKKVKHLKIFTSCDAYGKQAEYIRNGLNYETWLANIHKSFAEIPEIEFTIMSTYNILSVYTYRDFLKDVLDIKKKYRNPKKMKTPLLLDIPYLRYPEHQSVFISNPEMLQVVENDYKFMMDNLQGYTSETAYNGFFEFEADKLKRIHELMLNNKYDNEKIKRLRKDFVIFVDEHDRRRGTDFKSAFPELVNFYYSIKRDI